MMKKLLPFYFCLLPIIFLTGFRNNIGFWRRSLSAPCLAAASTNFAGFTVATYNGNMGGLAGANAKCAAEFPGSHLSNWQDIKCPPPVPVWINNQAPWVVTPYSVGHCYSWTSSAFSGSFNPYGATVSSTCFLVCAPLSAAPPLFWMSPWTAAMCSSFHPLSCSY